MPVGLSPAAAPTTKSKSVEISASYPILSTFRFPIKAARTAAYLLRKMIRVFPFPPIEKIRGFYKASL
jgi:hypothetical protein